MSLSKKSLDPASPSPLYLQIAEVIRGKILSGEFKENYILARESELAGSFGVSLITTGKALGLLVKEGLIYRRPKLGTFVTKADRKRQRTSHVLFILCHRRIPDHFYSWLFNSVEEECERRYCLLNLFQFHGGGAALDKALNQHVGGVILCGVVRPEICRYMQKKRIPFVVAGLLADRWKGEKEIYQVAIRPEKFGEKATEYLLSRGRQRLALFSGSFELPYYRLVRAGFRKSLRAAGKPRDPHMEVCGNGRDDSEECGYRLIVKLLPLAPDAVLCANTSLAVGAMKRVREQGLAVPHDIAFMAIGNMPAASFSHPGLTCLDENIPAMGKKAAEMIMELIEGRSIQKKALVESIKIVERGSV